MPFAGGKICRSCYLSHLDAVRAISEEKPPAECSECHLSWRELCDRAGIHPDQQATMQVHYESGIYRFMCKACSREYVRKRAELYGPTEFGHRIGIK